jgi:hypothetical protein
MQRLDRFCRLFRLLRALTEHIRRALQKLLLPIAYLVRMDIVFLNSFHHRQVAL